MELDLLAEKCERLLPALDPRPRLEYSSSRSCQSDSPPEEERRPRAAATDSSSDAWQSGLRSEVLVPSPTLKKPDSQEPRRRSNGKPTISGVHRSSSRLVVELQMRCCTSNGWAPAAALAPCRGFAWALLVRPGRKLIWFRTVSWCKDRN